MFVTEYRVTKRGRNRGQVIDYVVPEEKSNTQYEKRGSDRKYYREGSKGVGFAMHVGEFANERQGQVSGVARA